MVREVVVAEGVEGAAGGGVVKKRPIESNICVSYASWNRRRFAVSAGERSRGCARASAARRSAASSIMLTISGASAAVAFARTRPLAAAMKPARFSFVGSIFDGVSAFVWMKRFGPVVEIDSRDAP